MKTAAVYDSLCSELLHSRIINLGRIKLKVSSNIPIDSIWALNKSISASSYSEKYDYHITLYKCNYKDRIFEYCQKYGDNTTRNKLFNKGYYVCDHFGEPINMISNANEYIIVGNEIERIFWSYLVKWVMQIWAIRNNAIFAKCAAFSSDNSATVLIGRGGSGKTFINSYVCRNFGTFITNSNALIKSNSICGIGANIRARNDLINHISFDSSDRTSNDSSGETIINPYAEFKCDCNNWIPIKNIIIVNYKSGNNHLEKIEPVDCVDYAKQFLLGLNVYRLEEDVFEYLDEDAFVFAENYRRMEDSLVNCVLSSNCFYADVDITDKKIISEFNTLL